MALTNSPMLANGQLDLSTAYLGREVVEPTDALQVIRPQMRMCRCLYRGVIDAAREGWLEADEDLELTDGGDIAAWDAMFLCLIEDAMENIRQWANDLALVYDKERMREFIRLALVNSMATGGVEMLPPDALDY